MYTYFFFHVFFYLHELLNVVCTAACNRLGLGNNFRLKSIQLVALLSYIGKCYFYEIHGQNIRYDMQSINLEIDGPVQVKIVSWSISRLFITRNILSTSCGKAPLH